MSTGLRIGNGYDVHRLVEGIPLVLGGVKFEFDKGLQGHSDGDALTHAIINALLGAACLGDIGTHFPPGDPRFKGANSQGLLATAHGELIANGWRIVNIDSQVICEKPKLSTRYSEMRAALAKTLGIDVSLISVKAGTAEGLGSIGGGNAIAAIAVALIEKT